MHPAEATRELARVGMAAMPPVEALAPMHLRAIEEALRGSAVPSSFVGVRRTRGLRTRRAAIVFAAAAFVLVPSMAFAGVLPAQVQHAASQVAGAIGVTLPDPADDRAREALEDAGPAAGDDRGEATDETGLGLGDEIRGTVPGKPEPGEVRGNRFGQVEGGPDQGKAGAAQAEHKPATPPASTSRPTSPPGQSGTQGGGSDQAPATTPAPAAGGSNAGGGGKPDGVGKGR